MSEVPVLNEALVLNLQQVFDYVGTTTTYYGYAAPGVKTSAAQWKIKQEIRDSQNRTSTIRFAGGSINYDQVWDNHLTLAYS